MTRQVGPAGKKPAPKAPPKMARRVSPVELSSQSPSPVESTIADESSNQTPYVTWVADTPFDPVVERDRVDRSSQLWQELTRQLAAVENENALLRVQLADLRENRSGSLGDNFVTRDQYDAMEERCNVLEDRLAEFEDIGDELDALRRERDELRDRKHIDEESALRLRNLEAHVAELESENEALHSKQSSSQAEIFKLQAEVQRLERERAASEDAVRRRTAQVQEYEESVAKLNAKLAALDKELASSQKSDTAQRQKNQELTARVQNLEGQLAQQRRQIEAMDKYIMSRKTCFCVPAAKKQEPWKKYLESTPASTPQGGQPPIRPSSPTNSNGSPSSHQRLSPETRTF
eukprot:TRINITY_DN1382_c0_g1_i1.p1 TRINITY_DN1382_c0_g1~~TRINITY_DN1382_c0_g1_i1.p1  ORF type:complete len:348 (-),score=61.25 TRINITY_DN1382_c0_g1_i1:87-1130(-)